MLNCRLECGLDLGAIEAKQQIVTLNWPSRMSAKGATKSSAKSATSRKRGEVGPGADIKSAGEEPQSSGKGPDVKRQRRTSNMENSSKSAAAFINEAQACPTPQRSSSQTKDDQESPEQKIKAGSTAETGDTAQPPAKKARKATAKPVKAASREAAQHPAEDRTTDAEPMEDKAGPMKDADLPDAPAGTAPSIKVPILYSRLGPVG